MSYEEFREQCADAGDFLRSPMKGTVSHGAIAFNDGFDAAIKGFQSAIRALPLPEVSDVESVQKTQDALVKRLDIALNGENAAEQASLCDIVAQCEATKFTPVTEAQPMPESKQCDCKYCGDSGHVHRADGEYVGQCSCIAGLAVTIGNLSEHCEHLRAENRQLRNEPDAEFLRKENEQLRQRIAELEPDAKRYQFLKETPTWSIEFVRADGAPMSRADKFAIGFCKNYEDLTAEWSVRFCVDYGLCGESEDDLNMAIDAALKGGAE